MILAAASELPFQMSRTSDCSSKALLAKQPFSQDIEQKLA